MNREQLEHTLRAASGITGETVLLVIGSQSILGSFDEDDLPEVTMASMEVDIGFFNDPGGHKADLIEGAIGEESDFDRLNGYYVDGVDLSTATLPNGWWDRLITLRTASTDPAEGRLLEPHDCVVSKLVAGREKDIRFAAALLDAGLVHADVLIERVALTEMDERIRRRIVPWLESYSE